MYEPPKQRCTQEFKQEAVPLVESEGMSPCQGRQAGREWLQGGHARADGVVAVESRERAAQDGSRNSRWKSKSWKKRRHTLRRCDGEVCLD